MDKLTLLVDVRILSDKIKQLEADKESIEKDRLAIATKYNNQMIKIKQLEAEIAVLNESISEYDKAVNSLEAENQRLKEALVLIRQNAQSKSGWYSYNIAQKALKEE